MMHSARGMGIGLLCAAAGCAAPRPGPIPNGLALFPVEVDSTIVEPESRGTERERIARELGESIVALLGSLSPLPCRVGEPGQGEVSLRIDVARIERADGDPILYSAWELRDPAGALLDAYAGRFDTAEPPTSGPGMSRRAEVEGVDPLLRGLRLYAVAIADRVAGRLRRGSGAAGEARP